MLTHLKNQKGVTLILIVILLIVVSTLVIGVLTTSVAENEMSMDNQKMVQADYIAQSAVSTSAAAVLAEIDKLTAEGQKVKDDDTLAAYNTYVEQFFKTYIPAQAHDSFELQVAVPFGDVLHPEATYTKEYLNVPVTLTRLPGSDLEVLLEATYTDPNGVQGQAAMKIGGKTVQSSYTVTSGGGGSGGGGSWGGKFDYEYMYAAFQPSLIAFNQIHLETAENIYGVVADPKKTKITVAATEICCPEYYGDERQELMKKYNLEIKTPNDFSNLNADGTDLDWNNPANADRLPYPMGAAVNYPNDTAATTIQGGQTYDSDKCQVYQLKNSLTKQVAFTGKRDVFIYLSSTRYDTIHDWLGKQIAFSIKDEGDLQHTGGNIFLMANAKLPAIVIHNKNFGSQNQIFVYAPNSTVAMMDQAQSMKGGIVCSNLDIHSGDFRLNLQQPKKAVKIPPIDKQGLSGYEDTSLHHPTGSGGGGSSGGGGGGDETIETVEFTTYTANSKKQWQ